MLGVEHLRRDLPLHDPANLLHHLEEVLAGLVDQRGIGGDAIEQTRFSQVADLGGVGGVDEEFHLGHAFERFGDSRSEEHTSELQSLMRISSAVFCLKNTYIKLQ